MTMTENDRFVILVLKSTILPLFQLTCSKVQIEKQ